MDDVWVVMTEWEDSPGCMTDVESVWDSRDGAMAHIRDDLGAQPVRDLRGYRLNLENSAHHWKYERGDLCDHSYYCVLRMTLNRGR